MCLYSTFWNNWEKKNLAPYAVLSDDVWYTQRSDGDTKDTAFDAHGSRSRYRTAFQIDKDRIAKSQAFRRLEYKTQIFVTHEGDNYRTRLTHSLEVSEVARHIARALRLNEHLVEAISLGHDLGHAPYGHSGEDAINDWLGEQDAFYKDKYYFSHNQQSVEVVEFLEPGYDWDSRKPEEFGKGLNVTIAVKEGILRHASFSFRGAIHQDKIFAKKYGDTQIIESSKRSIDKKLFAPGTLEAQVVRIADDIAQRISDLEDGLRSNVLKKEQIIEVIIKSFEKIKKKIFPDDNKKIGEYLEDNIYIKHPEYKTKIPFLLLTQIVDFLNKNDINIPDTTLRTDYKTNYPNSYITKDTIDIYDEQLKDAALIAFLLHMWRSAETLNTFNKGDQEKHRTRILKYLKLYQEIKKTPPKDIPSYHLIGFLRGILLANVIEHSFWNLHYCLNKDFSKFLNTPSKETVSNGEQVDPKWHLIFVVVDGLLETDDKGKVIKYNKVTRYNNEGDGLYHFEFKTSDEMNNFIKVNIETILKTNGSHLIKLKGTQIDVLDKVDWLNKSENLERTEHVTLTNKDSNEKIKVPIQNVRIYYTGYRELCPGTKGRGGCSYSSNTKANGFCVNGQCPFYDSEVKYPDINRLIQFHEYGKILDSQLRRIINERIHNSPKVARMNRMGKIIIKFLLNQYLMNPRIMHQRVWLKIAKYDEASPIDKSLEHWINTPINAKKDLIFPSDAYKEITNYDSRPSNTQQHNRYSLIRRIISHVAGMTDRYIKNEYNSLTRGGGETQIPDETYFFM
ncbi:MAG: dNTP triphosphohydrolase [Desulfamplus sp.]|nr:dNTP triphosphohydrolase [Desulfamplus sp.]